MSAVARFRMVTSSAKAPLLAGQALARSTHEATPCACNGTLDNITCYLHMPGMSGPDSTR